MNNSEIYKFIELKIGYNILYQFRISGEGSYEIFLLMRLIDIS